MGFVDIMDAEFGAAGGFAAVYQGQPFGYSEEVRTVTCVEIRMDRLDLEEKQKCHDGYQEHDSQRSAKLDAGGGPLILDPDPVLAMGQ